MTLARVLKALPSCFVLAGPLRGGESSSQPTTHLPGASRRKRLWVVLTWKGIRLLGSAVLLHLFLVTVFTVVYKM